VGGFASLQRSLGRGILHAAPYLMKTLSVVGTAAMFLVGVSILVHGIPGSHDYVHAVVHAVETLSRVGGALAMLAPLLINALTGIIAGAVIQGAVSIARRLLR
jgi:uncharacterized protein